ncbi:hypothetical protein ACOME3_006171 [Neoechinorhynchus agilis]
MTNNLVHLEEEIIEYRENLPLFSNELSLACKEYSYKSSIGKALHTIYSSGLRFSPIHSATVSSFCHQIIEQLQNIVNDFEEPELSFVQGHLMSIKYLKAMDDALKCEKLYHCLELDNSLKLSVSGQLCEGCFDAAEIVQELIETFLLIGDIFFVGLIFFNVENL